jgi:hypothetical protein
MADYKNYLINMYNATSTDDGNGEIETYEAWLEKQLIIRIEKIETLEREQKLIETPTNAPLVDVSKSEGSAKTTVCELNKENPIKPKWNI